MSELYPKFLKNEPIGEDQFEGKSQESMAEIISETLKKPDYGIIGIDGSWGSGKSNLVRIVKGKLDSNKFHFFLYDVWGHQEDEQRRSILVELTELIAKEENSLVKNKKNWEEKLTKLLSNRKDTTTTNLPYLSIGFIFSLLAIVYVPTVNVFKDSLKDFFQIESWFWKLVLVAFPIFIVFFIYLYNLGKNWRAKKGFSDSFTIAAQETFQVYTNQQREVKKTEVISDIQPSVRDFRTWIGEIDEDLEKKIVIVFDNFDRLPQKQIQSIWSSIHIFFAEKKYKNIKVIIPFDREHIKNAFGDLKHKNQEKEFGDYAEDYINKTFDIVYRVAPPILTNWKSFFEIKWAECFGADYDREEFRRTTQVYEIQNKKITPREIIVLINEIATLKQIHSGKIPAQYLALFVINKTKILEDPVSEISNPTFIKGLEFIYSNDIELAKYITAIIYQLDPEKSLEIVFEQRLYDALIKKDHEELNTIAESNIFTSILETTYPKIDDEFIPNAIESLSIVASEKFNSEIRENLIWKDFIKRSYSVENIDHKIKNFQKVILTKISNKEEKLLYVQKIIAELSYDEKWDTLNYANNIDELQKYLTDQKIVIDVEDNLEYYEINNVEEFIALVRTKKEDYQKYRIDVDGDELDDNLALIEVGKLEEIDFTKYLNRDDYKLPKFEKQLYADLKTNFADNELLAEILRLLKEFGKPIKTDALTDANLYSRFTTVTAEDEIYYDFLAMRLSRDLALGGYQSYFTADLNKIEDSFVEKVAREILHYIDFDDFLLKHVEFKSSALYKEIVQKLVNDSSNMYGRYLLTLKNVLPSIELISADTEIELGSLIKKFNSWSASELTSTAIKDFSNHFFEKAIEFENKLTSKCIELKKEYFDSLTKEEWAEVFSDVDSEDFKILSTINYDTWSSISHEALKENLIEKSINFSEDDISKKDDYSNLIKSMEYKNHKFKNTFDDIRDEFIKNNNISNDSFYFFGDGLFQFSNLKVDSTVRTIFKTELLDDEHSIDILERNVKKLKTALEFSKDEAQDFINSLLEKAKTDEAVKNLGEQLGLIKKAKTK